MKYLNHSLLVGCCLLGLACSGASKKTKESSAEERSNYYLSMASAAIRSQEYTRAFQDLAEAEKLSGPSAKISNTRALAYIFSKQPEAAEAELQRALKLEPKNPSVNLTYAKILLDQRKFSQARKHLEGPATDSAFRDQFKALSAIGLSYYREGQYAQAADYFHQSVALAPGTSCLANYYIGHIEMQKKNFNAAMKHYDAAGRGVCGGFSRAHYAEGVALMKNKKFDLARKKFLEVQKLFPGTAEAKKSIRRIKEIP